MIEGKNAPFIYSHLMTEAMSLLNLANIGDVANVVDPGVSAWTQRQSRYREPPVALAPDARGRTPATDTLRARPDVTGTFRHVVAEGERLDQIAYRYYEEPTSWWRICDANPEFLSPLALLGQESGHPTRFPIRAAPRPGRTPIGPRSNVARRRSCTERGRGRRRRRGGPLRDRGAER